MTVIARAYGFTKLQAFRISNPIYETINNHILV